jgi:putative two-component system response regulator
MPDSIERRRILVVDDEERMVRFIRMNLEHDGFQVSEAFNGKQAIQKMRDVTPDLILLDVMMPGMDGYEVCRRIMADERTRHIPVIFLTAKAEIEDEKKGLELGAVDYITKPISPPIVLARVKTHLLLKSARDFLKDQNAYLEEEVERRVREIQRKTGK